MSNQLHKNFTDDQVKSFLKSYLDKEIKIIYILQMLKIKRRKFFELLAKYCKDPDNFSIQYERKTINQKLDRDIKKNIVEELKMETGGHFACHISKIHIYLIEPPTALKRISFFNFPHLNINTTKVLKNPSFFQNKIIFPNPSSISI